MGTDLRHSNVPVVVGGGDVKERTYMDAYGYERPADERITEERERVSARLAMEPKSFKERRRTFQNQLSFLDAAEACGADFIDLPAVSYLGAGRWQVHDNWRGAPLYLGGVKHRLTIGTGRPGTYETKSLYIGDMPQTAMARYCTALRYFADDQLAVVSRDHRLFDLQTHRIPLPAPSRSPLLIVASPYGPSRFLLLAAWGMEHELPRSLGGVLDEPGQGREGLD